MRFPTFAAAAPSANQPDIRLVTFSLRGNEKHAAPHVPGMYAVARSAFLCSLIRDLPERLRDSKLHAACSVFHSLLVHESLGIPAHDHANTVAFFAPPSDSAYDVGRGRLSVFFIGNCALPPSRLRLRVSSSSYAAARDRSRNP